MNPCGLIRNPFFFFIIVLYNIIEIVFYKKIIVIIRDDYFTILLLQIEYLIFKNKGIRRPTMAIRATRITMTIGIYSISNVT